MNLKCTVLSERKDADNLLCDPICKTFWKRQIDSGDEKLVVRGCGEGEDLTTRGQLRELRGHNGTVLYLDCGSSCQLYIL